MELSASPFALIFSVAVYGQKFLLYVDPGTGSYLFQIALAGFLGALFTLRSFWKGIRGRIARWVLGQACLRSQRDELS